MFMAYKQTKPPNIFQRLISNFFSLLVHVFCQKLRFEVTKCYKAFYFKQKLQFRSYNLKIKLQLSPLQAICNTVSNLVDGKFKHLHIPGTQGRQVNYSAIIKPGYVSKNFNL